MGEGEGGGDPDTSRGEVSGGGGTIGQTLPEENSKWVGRGRGEGTIAQTLPEERWEEEGKR